MSSIFFNLFWNYEPKEFSPLSFSILLYFRVLPFLDNFVSIFLYFSSLPSHPVLVLVVHIPWCHFMAAKHSDTPKIVNDGKDIVRIYGQI